jgi:hypothetical protein
MLSSGAQLEVSQIHDSQLHFRLLKLETQKSSQSQNVTRYRLVILLPAAPKPCNVAVGFMGFVQR